FLDEIHQRISIALEDRVIPERIVVRDAGHVAAAALHALKNHHVTHHRVVQDVEREQRVAEVIEHAHEDDHVELLAEFADIVDIHFAELDVVVADDAGGEAALFEIRLIAVDGYDARGAALLHLDRVEAGVAADIEHRLAGQVGRNGVREVLPFDVWIVAEKMVGRRLHAAEIDVVKPTAEG